MAKGMYDSVPLLKTLDKEKRRNFTMRMSAEEMKQLQEKADLYTNGNLSQWIRYAAFNYVPKKSELSGK
jgi:hypothetical protein